MYYLICFDISNNRIRYRATKLLKGYGSRVQKSVFECADLTEKQLLTLQDKLQALVDQTTDSIRYYRLCRRCCAEIEWLGAGKGAQNENFVVI